MRKLRSRVTVDGLDRAPHRAFMRAMGLDDAAIEKPMIGVVSMKGEQTPCNMTHDFQVAAAKEGIAEAGGCAREFATVSVSDGISMNHEGMKFSLFSRELIADSIEAVVHGLAYDALIGFGGCDKTLPGVMMGMVRCNVPSIFIYGGSALPGRFKGKTLTVLDSYEAVGGFMTAGCDGDRGRTGGTVSSNRGIDMQDHLNVAALVFPGMDQIDLTGPFAVLSRLPDSTVQLVWSLLRPWRK